MVNKYKLNEDKKNDKILLDIHRPENFKYKDRLENIIKYANYASKQFDLPVFMLGFGRTLGFIKEYNINLGDIQIIDLLPFKTYLNEVYHSKFIISDSGTSQEEPALLNTPVIVPRDFTERPESVDNNCSFMLDVNSDYNYNWSSSLNWILSDSNNRKIEWLGDGTTSEQIIKILNEHL